jgi:hypothetical protein
MNTLNIILAVPIIPDGLPGNPADGKTSHLVVTTLWFSIILFLFVMHEVNKKKRKKMLGKNEN